MPSGAIRIAHCIVCEGSGCTKLPNVLPPPLCMAQSKSEWSERVVTTTTTTTTSRSMVAEC
eukprot:3547490-Amphidinium_carterae.2